MRSGECAGMPPAGLSIASSRSNEWYSEAFAWHTTHRQTYSLWIRLHDPSAWRSQIRSANWASMKSVYPALSRIWYRSSSHGYTFGPSRLANAFHVPHAFDPPTVASQLPASRAKMSSTSGTPR